MNKPRQSISPPTNRRTTAGAASFIQFCILLAALVYAGTSDAGVIEIDLSTIAITEIDCD